MGDDASNFLPGGPMQANSRDSLLKVLIVDDDHHLTEGLARTLRRFYEVHTAGSGREGLDLVVERGPFGVVISDMWMPLMNGIAFLRELHRIDGNTVGIILTGDACQATAVDAINEVGVYRFHRKPCKAEELELSVRLAFEEYARRRTGWTVPAPATDAVRTAFEVFAEMNDAMRAPLNQILGLSEVLESLLPEGHRQRPCMNAFRYEGRRLRDTMGKLDRCRDSSQTPFRLRRVRIPLSEVAAKCLAALAPELKRRKLQVASEIDPDFPVLYVDSGVFCQLMSQLLDFALGGTLDGGTVTLRGIVSSSGDPTIAIADSGVGLAPDELQRVTQPGLRGAIRDTSGGDARRSLFLSRVLAEIHEIGFSLTSRLGEGSIAYLRLPPSCFIHSTARKKDNVVRLLPAGKPERD